MADYYGDDNKWLGGISRQYRFAVDSLTEKDPSEPLP